MHRFLITNTFTDEEMQKKKWALLLNIRSSVHCCTNHIILLSSTIAILLVTVTSLNASQAICCVHFLVSRVSQNYFSFIDVEAATC